MGESSTSKSFQATPRKLGNCVPHQHWLIQQTPQEKEQEIKNGTRNLASWSNFEVVNKNLHDQNTSATNTGRPAVLVPHFWNTTWRSTQCSFNKQKHPWSTYENDVVRSQNHGKPLPGSILMPNLSARKKLPSTTRLCTSRVVPTDVYDNLILHVVFSFSEAQDVKSPITVEVFLLSRRPSSSAEVRVVVIHDTKEVEGVKQQ